MSLAFKLPFRTKLLFVVLVLLAPAFSSTHRGTINGWTVTTQPKQLVNGSPLLVFVKAPRTVDELSGEWLGKSMVFSFDSASKSWYALAGVSLETKPGTYTLQLSGTSKAGQKLTLDRHISVGKAKHRRISVSVSKKFTEPSAEQLRTIAEDKQTKEAAFSRISPLREWSGDFRAPVGAPVSDVFGTERVFNGKVQSYHQGLDFGVPSGTSVSALNSGTVLLARNLYFEGNCVVIDHGQGLLSLYLHLSEFGVKEGESVKGGQVIGLSGGTGRATGPHLHVAVRWQGIYLDPAILLTLKLPISAAS